MTRVTLDRVPSNTVAVTVTAVAAKAIGTRIGEEVVLTGTGFAADDALVIGGIVVTDKSFVNVTTWHATIPTGVTPGVVTATVEGVVSPSFTVYAAPDLYPSDGTAAWGFEGATDAIASGSFVSGSLQSFIANTEWERDGTIFKAGSQSVRQDYPQSAGNIGTAFLYLFGTAQSHFFVSFYYRADANMPYDDFYKVMRHYLPGIAGSSYFDLGVLSDGRLYISDNGVNQATGTPAIQMRNLNETWLSIEYEADIRTPSAAEHRLWVNGTLQAERTGLDLSAKGDVGVIQFNGTINSMSIASSAWWDRVAISTQRLGP